MRVDISFAWPAPTVFDSDEYSVRFTKSTEEELKKIAFEHALTPAETIRVLTEAAVKAYREQTKTKLYMRSYRETHPTSPKRVEKKAAGRDGSKDADPFGDDGYGRDGNKVDMHNMAYCQWRHCPYRREGPFRKNDMIKFGTFLVCSDECKTGWAKEPLT